MKYFTLLCLLLAGCSNTTPLTNEEIVQQVRICHAAGMDYEAIANGWTYDILAIHCSEKHK